MIYFLMMATVMTLSSLQANEKFKQVQELGGITEYSHNDNGLTVLLKQDKSAPVVTVMITYNVGSRNEVTGTTGATHLLEHLMFKGTDKYNRAAGTGMDGMLQNRGAQLNATTWLDRTNYFENLPSQHLELAIDIEADRMRNLWLREEDRAPEMTVVRNEFERGENSPFGSLNKAIWSTAFIAHPYHHSTIGWRSDIEGVPIEKLRAFYNTYYWPNNATLTVIGDFDTANALALVDKYFGAIPKSPHPIPDVYTKEPEQLGQRRVEVNRAGRLGALGVAHKAPEGTHEDTPALDVLSTILSDGKTARLYKSLVDEGKATNVFSQQYYLKDPSIFSSFAFLAPGASHDEVEEIIMAEYDRIKEEGVTDDEVERAKSKLIASTKFQRDGSFSVASVINEWIAMGDWTYYVKYEDLIDEINAEDVKRVANTYLNKKTSTVGYFIPEMPGGAARRGASPSPRSEFDTKVYYRAPGTENNEEGITSPTFGQNNEPTKVSKSVKEKKVRGIRVITNQTGVEDVVTLRGSFEAGDVFNPENNSMVSSLVAEMLDQGTTKRDKFVISEELESMGAQVSFFSGTINTQFFARFLKQDLDKVVAIIAEQLREPAFNADELEKLKKRMAGGLQRQLENTGAMAGGELSRIVYPNGHPNYSVTVEQQLEDLEKLSVDDLKAFHKKYFGPKSMVVVGTGDVDAKAVQKAIGDAFKGWKGGTTFKNTAPKAPASTKTEKDVYMADKTSVSVNFAIPVGIDSNHPDYNALYLGTYVLGGNFSARLMSTVRDQEGLTYGINSFVTGATLTDGHWQVTATFAPDLLDKGIESTMTQLEKWVKNGITAEELEAKKQTVNGSYQVQLATSGGMAAAILSTVNRRKSISYMDKYLEEIDALTLKEVNDAIKKYIGLNRLVIVKAGTIPRAEPESAE